LSIARTSKLQTAINGKQATITDGSLSIARTSGLQNAINGKQPSIATASFTPSLTSFATPVACSFGVQMGDLTASAIYGGASTQITSAISAATSLCVPNTYGATVNAYAYAASTGTWTGGTTSNSWSVDHHIGGYGNLYSATGGVNTATSETVKYNFPAGFVGGTAYLNHFSCTDHGYFDVLFATLQHLPMTYSLAE